MKKSNSGFVEMKATSIEANANGTDPKGIGTPQGRDYHAVGGLDVGDRRIHYCVLDMGGELAVEGAMSTQEAALRVQFEGKARMRIALEAGTHSPWISRLLVGWGHDVIVANPRKVRLISSSDSKNDPADARTLARLAQVGPELLSPVRPRSEKTQIDPGAGAGQRR